MTHYIHNKWQLGDLCRLITTMDVYKIIHIIKDDDRIKQILIDNIRKQETLCFTDDRNLIKLKQIECGGNKWFRQE